jgi:hypothetical protein
VGTVLFMDLARRRPVMPSGASKGSSRVPGDVPEGSNASPTALPHRARRRAGPGLTDETFLRSHIPTPPMTVHPRSASNEARRTRGSLGLVHPNFGLQVIEGGVPNRCG